MKLSFSFVFLGYCLGVIFRPLSKRVEWENDPAFFDRLRAAGLPTVIQNSVFTKSKVTQWNADYFKRTMKGTTLKGKESGNPDFSVGCCPLRSYSFPELWDKLYQERDDYYYYVSSPLHHLPLARDLPLSYLRSQAGYEEQLSFFWLGSKGATTPLHYDVYDNLFQQLSGRKRFLLLPPSEAARLYLHPKVHVRYRQSQADILRPDFGRHPLLAGLEGIEVVLEPGDLLYLPAFWFHQVDALAPNYGLNVWFRNAATELMSGAWQQGLPLSDNWSQGHFETALAEFTQALVVASDLVWPGVTSNLLNARYGPLYGRSEPASPSDLLLGIATAEDPHVQVHLSEQVQIDQSVFVPNVRPERFCASPRVSLEPSELTELRQAGAEIGRTFFAPVPEAIRLTYLTDYIEDLVGLTFGQRHTHRYFTACLGPAAECSEL